MTLKETLDKVGYIIAAIIVLVIIIQLLFVWTKYCDNFQDEDYDITLCVEKLIFLIIPNEVTMVQLFESSPYLMILILILYWKFVSPHLENQK